ncbi:MAG: hypothetical protein ACLQVJ_07270 [Syntrophobacteraceae bacterium]
MDELSIEFSVLHHIDLTSDLVRTVTGAGDASDVTDYIRTLLGKVTSEKNKRTFEFASETSEVRAVIPKIKDEASFDSGAQAIANRLHRIEKETQDRYDHITTIHKGSLLQVYLNTNGTNTFIVTKVDHNAFLDESDLRRKVGLPFERHVLKAAIIELGEDSEIQRVLVYDSNASISTYWWQHFLELTEINTDEYNTKISFNAIDGVLTKTVKKEHPSDYTFLRNNIISYYRTQPAFSIDGLVEHAIGEYEPEDPTLNMDEVKKKIMELPEKKKFDTKFKIERKVITARFKRHIALHEKIDLYLKEDVENLEEVITAFEDPTGDKFIRIKSETGYNAFRKIGN